MATMAEILSEIKILKEEIQKSNLFKKPFLTTKEVALVLGLSVSFVQKLIASKQITYYRPTGKITFVKRSDLEDFIMKNPIHSEDDIDTIVADNLLTIKSKTL